MQASFIFISTIILIIQLSMATDTELWIQFKEQHGKSYEFSEEEKRFQIFQENLRKIEYHNARYEQGKESYFLKVTQFSDLTATEFNQRLGYSIPTHFSSNITSSDVDLPYSVDWRDEGILSNIKNSGTDCISSWAFSATAAMESYYALGHRAVLSLSEQNLIDCSKDVGNNGCKGGFVNNSFVYVQDNGIMFQLEYPYEGKDGNCNFDRLRKSPVGTVGTATVEPGEIPLMITLYYNGPVNTLMNGDNLQQYAGGILDLPNCSPDVNYNVLVIGYGVEEDTKKKFWIIRNSWGTTWGESGYFRMIRSENTQCGFGNYNYYPLVLG